METGSASATADQSQSGLCRAALSWKALDNTVYTAVGTHKKLYIFQGGEFYNVTPIRRTQSRTNAFATTDGSSAVTITDANHGAQEGDGFVLDSSVSVGGLTLLGTYEILTVPTGNTFTIDAGSDATSTVAAGGGTVDLSYEISIGLEHNLEGAGWGAGTWGASTWGTPRSVTVSTGSLRVWAVTTFGEILLACPSGGPIYSWNPSTADPLTVRAAVVTNAPSENAVILGTAERHLVSFGTLFDNGTFDPTLIRWTAQATYTTDVDGSNAWEPTDENSAGDTRLAEAHQIQGIRATRGQVLIFTEDALYGLLYIGSPFIFTTNLISAHAGIISRNAHAELHGAAYWMSNGVFYRYDGAVAEVPCSVLDYVFDRLDRNQRQKIVAGVNPSFDEIVWFYPSQTSDPGECDSYVAYNVLDGSWTIGSLDRTFWEDSEHYQYPVALGGGEIYYHEKGTNADGSALGEHIESGYFDLDDGDHCSFLRRLIPDFDMSSGSVDVTVKTKAYPRSTARSYGPYTVTPTTEKIDLRARGRQINFRLDNAALDTGWRMDVMRGDVVPDGKR
jgi:hypothetical protein